MVVANADRVRQEMRRAGLSTTQLAARMGVHEKTVQNILRGEPLSAPTQDALFRALEKRVPITKLFRIVVAGTAETGTSRATVPEEASR